MGGQNMNIPASNIIRKHSIHNEKGDIDVDIYIDNENGTFERILILKNILIKHYVCDQYDCVLQDYGDAAMHFVGLNLNEETTNE